MIIPRINNYLDNKKTDDSRNIQYPHSIFCRLFFCFSKIVMVDFGILTNKPENIA